MRISKYYWETEQMTTEFHISLASSYVSLKKNKLKHYRWDLESHETEYATVLMVKKIYFLIHLNSKTLNLTVII